MKTTSIIYSLFVVSALWAAEAPAEKIYYTDFSNDLNDKKTISGYPKGSLSTSADTGKWFGNHTWSFVQASVIHTAPKYIPPMDSSGGAAATLTSGQTTLILDDLWDKNKNYTLTLRSRLTTQLGENGRPDRYGRFVIAVAAYNEGRIRWIGNEIEQHVSATKWTTTTLKVAGEKINGLHGSRIIFRIERDTVPDRLTLWIDSIQLDSETAMSDAELIKNIWN